MQPSHHRTEDWPVETFEAAPWHWLLVTAGLVLLGGLSVASIFGYVEPPKQLVVRIAVDVCAVVCWPLAAISLANMRLTGPVLWIGPEGVRDLRLSNDWIPWSAITGIRTTQSASVGWSNPVVRLGINRNVLKTMKMHRTAQFARWAALALSTSDLRLTTVGLRDAKLDDVSGALKRGYARARGQTVPPAPIKTPKPAPRGVPDWVWLALAAVAVSAVLAAVLAYLIETLPSADGPRPLIVGRLVVDWISFTVLISLLYGVAIYAIHYWDHRATYWEALICLTTLFVAGSVGRAIAELIGVKNADLLKAVYFVPAIGGYLFASWAFRRWRARDCGTDGS